MSTSQDLSGGSSGVSSLGIGIAIGVAGTIPVAVTVCCICYACHRRRYATQVAWLHYLAKNLTLVFSNSIECTQLKLIIAMLCFAFSRYAFYYGLTVA